MYFPIGDIHGCYDLVRRLYDKIVVRIEAGIDPVYGGTIVFLGDYIDRGPDTPKVLDFLMGLEDVNGDLPIKHIMLQGNHDVMMINVRRYAATLMWQKMWLNNGGKETIDQFGVTIQDIVDGALDKYIIWMENCPIIAQDPDYVFVHAGVNIHKPLNKQQTEIIACLWDINRDQRAYHKLNKIIVHGHTWQNKFPKPFVDTPNNRIWMDVGAGLFDMICTVCLPEPYDYGYESEGPYEIIRVKTF
jgi:serine/threonine protein phosphatase 1